ncbi:uncharacterized protein LOC126815703 [Patella vulgata]|uniref:uncharacterized protein LOC126815703 n=1 Tax=Patella vulgata TaxID=6465 RepID=UPI0024A8A698|nr:uncharacterized protein LOC126815703 [Patella vulgata]
MQEDKKDKLAICGKVAFGDKLKPSRLVEWFEMQMILGVDKIVVFDLDCPEQIKSVFKHYIDEGLLEVIPYSLPGKVPGYSHRGFRLKEQVYPQFSHDKHITVLDCHQRLGGYGYVLAADFDEIIIPSHHFTLKQLLQNLTSESPNAAGFYFHVQFHLENWGRVRTDSDIYFQQYLKSTKPRWECEKYIYIPSRTKSTTIHSFQPRYPFSKNYVDIKEATIHHYRQCPLGWNNCYPKVITDKQVSKYEELHTANTFKVFHKLNIKPYDHVTQTSEI